MVKSVHPPVIEEKVYKEKNNAASEDEYEGRKIG
jgi:hypothetical protein